MAGIDEETIFNLAIELLTNTQTHNQMAKVSDPYDAGIASERIEDTILYHFGFLKDRPKDFGEKTKY